MMGSHDISRQKRLKMRQSPGNYVASFDPKLLRELQTVRQLVKLTHQAPTREWPLVFVKQYDALLVVREWPDGSITAYSISEASRRSRSDSGRSRSRGPHVRVKGCGPEVRARDRFTAA
jgi:hypothetical protein